MHSTCAGPVAPPPRGLVATGERVPGFAQSWASYGGLCDGQVFVAQEPVRLYRIFTASYESYTPHRAAPLGPYWTLRPPTGSASEFRTTYEVCAEWNDLDSLNDCTLDVGAKVVMGPGQSVTCSDGTAYAASAANQVLVIKGPDGAFPVSDCHASSMKWQ
jgi:hypothetical protein